MRPLFKLPPGCTEPQNNGNAGLWYDKYCKTWHHNDSKVAWSLTTFKAEGKEHNPKQEWIDAVRKPVTNTVGNHQELEEACSRLKQLAKSLGHTSVEEYSTQWRFVTGLGRAHPVENGFAWHHTLGVPYLPGSSIKGMIRAWLREWVEDEKITTCFEGDTNKNTPSTPDEKCKALLNRIFGSDSEQHGSTGSVIFYDALPTRPVLLETDIMTPHYTPWYDSGEEPGDWYDPVPIPFLTVASQQYFQFIISPRNPENARSQHDTALVREWLADALEWIGAGAKTAVGYGRFSRYRGSITPETTEKIWEGATLIYTASDHKVTANWESNTATGKFNEIEGLGLGDRLSKNQKKKMKQNGITRTVSVFKSGNNYSLHRVANAEGQFNNSKKGNT